MADIAKFYQVLEERDREREKVLKQSKSKAPASAPAPKLDRKPGTLERAQGAARAAVDALKRAATFKGLAPRPTQPPGPRRLPADVRPAPTFGGLREIESKRQAQEAFVSRAPLGPALLRAAERTGNVLVPRAASSVGRTAQEAAIAALLLPKEARMAQPSGAEEVIGSLIGALAPIGLAASGVRAAGREIARRLPALAGMAERAPNLARTAARGAATGAGYWGLKQTPLRPPEERPTLAELPAEMAFFGAGDVGGQLASQILRRLAPTAPGIVEHGVRGGAVGATGMAAAIPLYPEDQRPSMQELATTAGSLALFSALTGALGGRAGLLRPAMETHRRFRQAWAGGDMETARAEYDRFWQDVNAAYAAARTAPGAARRAEIPEWLRAVAAERARLRTPALPEPRQKARLEAIEARRPVPTESPPMEGYEPLSEKLLPPQWQELLARARERMAAQPPRFTVKTRAAAGLWGRPEPPRPKPEPLHEQWLRILRERLAANEGRRATRSGGTVETVQGPTRPETPVRPSRVIEAPPLPTVRAPERQAETASAELLRQLERYGTARLNGTTAKIVQHPSGEGFAVEVTVSGQRNLIPSDPLTIEAARKEAVKALLAEATTPQVRSEQERPTVPLVVFGPKGERLTVVDDTDPAKLKVRNELGTEFWIGRKAVKAEPPAAQKAKREAIERGMEPVVQRWNGMSYDDRFNVAQTVGWNKRDSDKFAKSEWSKLSPAAQRVLQRYFASKQGKPPETPKATEASKPAAPGQIQGKTATAKTERGTAVETRYAVVDANDLIASHDTALRTDKRYPAELQPRDRSRAASKEQIGLIVNKLEPEFLGESPKASEGAPIVGPDLVVESGNGRVIALKTAYESGHENAGKYRQWLLDNAERFGLDKKALEGVERPVLVRVRQTDVDRVQFTREANEQAVAAMSATEQAMADAGKLSGALLDEFVPGENGEIIHRANWDFVRRFFQEVVGPAERGRYMTADGGISQEGVNRIRNAVFAKAYGDPAVLAKLAESTDSNIRNITNAMLIAAPRVAKMREKIARGELHDLDITGDLAAAVNKLSNLRETGQAVDVYLSQTRMFGEELSPLAKDILALFDRHKRNAKKLGGVLTTYVEMVEAAGDPRQASFFGKIAPRKDEVWTAAVRKAEMQGEAEALQASLFQSQAVRRGDASEAAPGMGEGAEPKEGGRRQGGGKEVKGLPWYRQAAAQAKAEAPAGGKPVGRVDIIRYIEDNLLAPVREGRMSIPKARGQYHTRTEVIRTKRPEDLQAIAHEVGHHLTKILKLDFEAYPELRPLGARLYPQADTKLQLEEGLAEFFRFYFVRPEMAKQAAPTFYRDFEARLEGDPQLKDRIREAQRLYQTWYGQGAVDRVKGAIVRDQPKDRPFLKTTEKLYADWVDDLYPLYKAVKTALGGKANPEKDLPILADPYRLARLARGRARKAVGMLERATVSPDLKIIGPGLREILKPVRNQIEDFTAYITARRAMELFRRGIESGIDPLDAVQTIKDLDSPAFRKAHEQLMKYQDNLIEHLVDAGVVARETADTMRELNRNYVPFYRYFGEEVASKGLVIGSRKRWTDLPKPVKGIKGSQRSIVDPLESIVRNTIWLIDIAERNRVARAMADIADKAEGMGWLMERVPTPVEPSRTDLERLERELERAGVPEEILDQIDFEKLAVTFNPVGYARIKEKKENILTVYRDGKPVFYQVHPELYRALEMLDTPSSNWFIRLLAFPARMLRAGAVLTPEFIARNPARDQLSAWAFSKYRFFPVVDLLRGLFHVAKRDDLYKLWEASGGAQAALVSLDRDYLQTNLRQLIGKQTAKERLRRAAVSPLTFLQTVSEAVEEATRVGEFARGVKREGMSREAKAKAAYSSREVTVDFSRAGYKGRQANEMVAFFNAGIQGTNRLWRAWREDPIGFTLKGVTFITIPSIILYLMNREDPRYKELPRWRRDLYWCIPGKGDTMYFIPKPFELGIVFGTSIERALEYIDEQDPKVLTDLAISAKEAGTPSVLPTALIPLAEAYANRSMFTGAPIVPMREQRLEPSEQYGLYTTGTARAVGKAFNVSPRKFEAMVRGYTGGLGMHALQLIDALTGNRAPGAELTEVAPVLKAYTGKAYRSAESIDVFYDELQRLERAYSTTQEQKKKGVRPTVTVDTARLKRLRRVEELLNKRRQKIRKIQETKALTPDEKRRQIDKLNVEMVNLARIALGKRPVSGAGGS